MNKRNKTYVFLLVFTIAGSVVDLFLPETNRVAQLSNLIQLIGMTILCRLWQNADSAQLGHHQSGASKSLTILFPIVGTAIYFIQSRHWKSATVAFFLFWIGIFAAMAISMILVVSVTLFLD